MSGGDGRAFGTAAAGLENGWDFRANLAKTRIAPDLLAAIGSSPAPDTLFDVIAETNSSFPGGPGIARERLLGTMTGMGLRARGAGAPAGAYPGAPIPVTALEGFDALKSLQTETYVFATLKASTIVALAAEDAQTGGSPSPIHKIWLDHVVELFVYESARTIKCDAARIAFACSGRDIVWAVADTGIDGAHPHFVRHGNLSLPDGLLHRDFTGDHGTDLESSGAALIDTDGHGTHVAGIIAGETTVGQEAAGGAGSTITKIVITQEVREDPGTVSPRETPVVQCISGLAPRCKLLSLKVLSTDRSGRASDLMAAIGYIRRVNGPGGNNKIHGLNLSLGYPFDARWFAAGQSPLCQEVDRLVRSGVVVVVAAGNAGYGRVLTAAGTSEPAGFVCSIADPGNARLAITVGSTHRDMPHVFGVSYFSSKGPTADGRMKPDLLAPGERIVSCAANLSSPGEARFRTDSGTSMAAPHVSGAIAGFLSTRREYIERPEDVKDIFLGSATDLKRRPEFQGSGLVDLMRALQSV